jgi:hypothetical protein
MSEPGNEFQGFAVSRGGLLREGTGGAGMLGAKEAILAAAREGLRKAAEDVVMRDAIDQAPELMPESMKRAGRTGGDQGGEPGELKDSAQVDILEDGNTAAISFNTIYASLQHERLDWHHESGNAKYLENAMNSTREEQVATIAEEIRKVTGGA